MAHILLNNMKNINNILKLLTWNNQSFPIGSYSFSSGLEYAIDSEIISSGSELYIWLKDFLKYGSLHTDAIFLTETWRLKNSNKNNIISDLNDFAISLNQSHEKLIENLEQGKSFIKITSDAWNHKFINKNLILPIAYASSAYQENISLEDTLICYLHSNLCNLLSAAIKLIPLGQTEGQQIQIKLNKHIDEEYKNIMNKDLNDIGNCSWVNDIVSMKHENQFTRIFRT